MTEERAVFAAKNKTVRLGEEQLERLIGEKNFAQRIAAIRRVKQPSIVGEEKRLAVAARTDAKMFAEKIETKLFR